MSVSMYNVRMSYGTNIFASRGGGQTFFVGGGGGHDDVDEEMDVRETSKLLCQHKGRKS